MSCPKGCNCIEIGKEKVDILCGSSSVPNKAHRNFTNFVMGVYLSEDSSIHEKARLISETCRDYLNDGWIEESL